MRDNNNSVHIINKGKLHNRDLFIYVSKFSFLWVFLFS